MATPIKSEYYRFNGTTWDLHYFRTSADLIVETTNYKVLTAAQQTAITDYLTTFNAANKLVKLDGSNKIPVTHIPSLSYLPLTGGALTGALSGTNITLSGNLIVGGTTYINGGIASDNETINVSVENINLTAPGGATIGGLKNPTQASQAATKEYVDNLVSAGFKVKEPVKAASLGNVDITLPLNSLDGVTLEANDRVLLRNQTNTAQNGVYQLNSSKIPVKVTADSTVGNSVFVDDGANYNDYIFVTSVLNTWSVFARTDTIVAGQGLERLGNTISVSNGAIMPVHLAGNIGTDKLANFTANQNLTEYTLKAPTTSQSIVDHLTNLYTAIKMIRGQSTYNSQPWSSLVTLKTEIDGKNRTEVGANLPTDNSTYRTGDSFFKNAT